MAGASDKRPCRKGESLPKRFGIGIALLVASEAALFAGQPWVAQWFTPLAWSAYILIMDGWIERRQGHSPLTRNARHVGFVALASIAIWVLFEGYNLHLDGWAYVGLPENRLARMAGYAWAFATIGPGLLVTAEWIASFRGPVAPVTRHRPGRRTLVVSVAAGLPLVIVPLLLPPSVAAHTWAAVWAGFVFLVDPLNVWRGRASLWSDVTNGVWWRVTSLLLSGAVCGVLWEFWNYWASGKWVYTFPFPWLRDVRLFEMPVAGFIGFPPFALEVFVLTELLAGLWGGTADVSYPGPGRPTRS